MRLLLQLKPKKPWVGWKTNLNFTQLALINHQINFKDMRCWVCTAPVPERFMFSAFLSWSSLRGFFYFKASLESFKPFSPLYNTFWHSLWLSFVFPGASLLAFILFSTQSLLLSSGLVPTCCFCSPYPLSLSFISIHWWLASLGAILSLEVNRSLYCWSLVGFPAARCPKCIVGMWNWPNLITG